MEFKKYQHLERFGTTEVQNIELGKCYVFPKIDGTNASVWLNKDGEVQAGSRKRHLSLEDDNAGFCAWVNQQENIKEYLIKNPNHRLFGEWLVKHSLKTYKDDAWRKFYVFDVYVDKEDHEIEEGISTMKSLHYDVYKVGMEEHGIDYIPPICSITNGSYEQFINQLQKNVFLIEDGKGIGEGIVIKNYDYENKYNRQTWAKIVGFVAATGVIGTLGTGVVNTVNHWYFYQTLPVRLDSIEVNIDNIENGDKKFYEFFDKKR